MTEIVSHFTEKQELKNYSPMAASYIMITNPHMAIIRENQTAEMQLHHLALVLNCVSVEQGFDVNQFMVKIMNGRIVENLIIMEPIRCPKSYCSGFD